MLVTCPGCSQTMQCPDDFAGKTASCKKCGAKFVIPSVQSTVAPTPAIASGNPFATGLSDAAESQPILQSGYSSGSRKGLFFQFVVFERMISLWLLIGLYWLSVFFFIAWGLWTILASFGIAATIVGQPKQQDPPPFFEQPKKAKNADDGRFGAASFTVVAGVCSGVAIMIFGPIVSRVYFEMIIVIFRMNETLSEIRDQTRKR